jgi:hypothetical protein
MENCEQNSNKKRICKICQQPLADDCHGNRKSHADCAKKYKKQHQTEKYKVGNSAKLLIQKNEAVAAHLYKLDQQKLGIPFTVAMELGFKFNCPTTKQIYLNKEINLLDQYGYSIETKKGEHLIFFYHEHELRKLS